MSRLRTIAVFYVCATLVFANSTFGGTFDTSVTCDAGYFLTDNGECEICPAGTYSAAGASVCTVCPSGTFSDAGASACSPCPEPNTHKRTTFPDYYCGNPVATRGYFNSPSGSNGLSQCNIINMVESDCGMVLDYAFYNPETEKYDKTFLSLWHGVKPGYYLATPGPCGAYAYYKDVKKCPAGHYCPGKQPVICNAGNKDTVHTPTFGLEICPAGTYSIADASACTVCGQNTWSDVGATACDVCPNIETGYGNSGSVITAHAGIESCVVLCPAGQYVHSAGAGCTNVGAGYWGTGGVADVDSTLPRNQCADGLTTIGFGPGADEPDDCGHILHLGDKRIYLRSAKRTTPALAVDVKGTVFYGNMTPNTSRSKVHVDIHGLTYSIHDDSK